MIVKRACLGYQDVKGRWICEDQCIKSSNGTSCGVTSHFTNFAILLSGAGGGKGQDDPCRSSSQDYTLPYISLGFVAGAICIVLISVIFIEVWFRKEIRRKNSTKVTVIFDS